MEQEIPVRYYNEKLKIAFRSWREVYLLNDTPKILIPEISKGNLVYRAKGSTQRFSYKTIKKGLVATTMKIRVAADDLLPF